MTQENDEEEHLAFILEPLPPIGSPSPTFLEAYTPVTYPLTHLQVDQTFLPSVTTKLT